MMTDPIADFLTRVRNSQAAGQASTRIPASKIKEAIADILKREGFIGGYEVAGKGVERMMNIEIRYDEQGKGMILGLERVSTPGRRVYVGKKDVPKILGGLGVAIVSTSQGVMTGNQARKRGIGGEVLARVW